MATPNVSGSFQAPYGYFFRAGGGRGALAAIAAFVAAHEQIGQSAMTCPRAGHSRRPK